MTTRHPWNVQRAGRAWSAEECRDRWELTPEKFELWHGRLFLEEEERLALLAMLLENVGADAAVRIGDPQVWKDAVANL